MELILIPVFIVLWLALLSLPFVLLVLRYRMWLGKPSKFSRGGLALIFFVWLVIVFFLLLLGLFPLFDVPFVLLFGWIVGVWRFFSGFYLEGIALLVVAVSGVMFFAMLHFFLRGIRRQYAKTWIFRQTLCVGGIMLAICFGGIAILAGIHEVYWAATGDEPWFEAGTAARRMQSSSQLKQIGLAAHIYHDANKTLSGSTMLDAETPGHSWATLFLPYLEQGELYEKIDRDVPWTAEKNREAFQKKFFPFRSPMMSERKSFNAEGYALAHYAVNERLLPVGKTLTLSEISDGTSNTIFAGEVNGNFRAWGDPVNARDPALGINKTPYGFGSRFPGGANMGLCDGSVTFAGDTIDPEILKAMAEPKDGKGGSL